MNMKPTLVIQCADVVNGGSVEGYFRERKLPYLWHRIYEGHAYPELTEFSRVICLGSPNSVHDSSADEGIHGLHGFAAAVLRNAIPILGICFGSQLLAKLLGAEVRRLTVPELGLYRIKLTEAGLTDPIFRGLESELDQMEWHGESFKIPTGATLLAEGEPCRNQAFRLGKAIGLQFHPEAVPEEIAAWADRNLEKLVAIGKSKESVVNECISNEKRLKKVNYTLLDNFLEE